MNGYVPSPTAELEEQLQLAYAAKDWRRVKRLATKLAAMKKDEGRTL